MPETIEVRRDGRVEWIRLNRPHALNALNKQMLRELRAALENAIRDDRVRVLVLTGAGRGFSAGGDLKEVLAELGTHGAGEQDGVELAIPTYTALRQCPKPVIAAVNGVATAGGFELLLFCDLIFAAQSARMGDAHANYGLLPGGGGAAALPRRIGLNRAKSLLFSGALLPASTLRDWGLVNEVVPDAELEAAVTACAQSLAEKSPLVLRGMKAVANAAHDGTEDMAMRHEALTLRRHMSSWDFREGLTAFTEKRKPQFEGR